MKKLMFLLFFVFAFVFELCAANEAWFARKFPPVLINSSGKQINTAEALKGKMVAVYFSASWCGPCRSFTPQLVKFYNRAARKSGLEIILVSSDRNSNAMMNYMRKDAMPWLAIPFGHQTATALKKELGIRGIPTLVVFDSSGRLVTKSARRDVAARGIQAVQLWRSSGQTANMSDNSRNSFNQSANGAWFAKKFPSFLTNSSGKKINTAAALKGKMVAVYFSASWCGPCRSFTPQLVKFYKRTARKNGMELVFVSSDKNKEAMMDYMKKDSMPWLAIPFNDPAILMLKKELRVNGIPTLVIFDRNGNILSTNARWDVVLRGQRAIKDWNSPDYKPKTYQDYQNSFRSNRKKRNKRK